ncbi:MAG: LacI family transcriptional regulator [Alcaligenes faecalis]|jgi:DNA-binding LacI/PurR family transcriptional regulator|uniref:LacI family transcriptional regulator n=1 Tax=Alcaligenes aquatilis TaxID=323284 RepID=A0ABY4NNH8_9BURK|nr:MULTISPECIES: LacI family DNA-binding transcriptional regulator [Alcaligenes]MCC9163100.1 LacI family transcriptional regulator [Alcaligenes sp. MMA]MCH4225316.1 LacI family transcriptional regulator [Alcaligenes faecalis]QXR37355.1 LacI family transcriptional regulator [Alcaligenes aquatilis]UQN37381.1 LacI family transcriptional regulator [Alcaligenes aquatilis]
MANVGILDVAKAAQVSVATVSRALNEPEKVGKKTLLRVQAAIQALGYQPNASARSLRSQRSRVIGVVLPTLLNPVFAECLKGIADTAAHAGYAILPFFTEYHVERESQAVALLLASNVEGIVLVVSNPATSPALERLSTTPCPYVLAYNQHPEHPCVSVNGEQAMIELIGHLATQGHRRIAMVSGHLHVSDRAQQRSCGYLKGMESAGLAPMPLLEVPFMDHPPEDPTAPASTEGGIHLASVARLLRQADRPTAVIGSNDLIAIRCLRTAQQIGLRVPQDISIIGFDGIGLGAELFPRPATIAQPNEEIGRQCIGLLLGSIARQQAVPAQESILLPYTFDPGESCAPSPFQLQAP